MFASARRAARLSLRWRGEGREPACRLTGRPLAAFAARFAAWALVSDGRSDGLRPPCRYGRSQNAPDPQPGFEEEVKHITHVNGG